MNIRGEKETEEYPESAELAETTLPTMLECHSWTTEENAVTMEICPAPLTVAWWLKVSRLESFSPAIESQKWRF